MFRAKAYCGCGEFSTVNYSDRSDVMLNEIDCACGRKSVPRYALYDPADGQAPRSTELRKR